MAKKQPNSKTTQSGGALAEIQKSPGAILPPANRLLREFKRQIEREHLACLQSASATVGHAICAGRALLSAKQLIGHGNWLAWLEKNFSFETGLTERTAQRYMKLAKHCDLLIDANQPQCLETNVPNTTRVSQSTGQIPGDMTISGALRIISADEHRANARHSPSNSTTVIRNNEWLAPENVVSTSIAVLGEIDLDPAAAACDNIPAAERYRRDHDSLRVDISWRGTVFLNPGFKGNLSPWVAKAIGQFQDGDLTEAIVVLPAATNTAWADCLSAFPRCFISGPTIVATASGEANGKLTHPMMVVYVGPSDRFHNFGQEFSRIGNVYLPFSQYQESGD